MEEIFEQLVEDVALLKREMSSLSDARWQQVGDNFNQLNNNLIQLSMRLDSIVHRLERVENAGRGIDERDGGV